MTTEKLQLLFDVRRSARYHEHRLNFFSFWHQLTSFLTILLSGSVLVQLSDANFKSDWWMTVMSLTAALLAALDMVVGYAKMAGIHQSLKRKYCVLEERIFSADPKINIDKFSSERLQIEMEEPPIYSALDLVTRNEQAVAEGLSHDIVRVSIYKYVTRNYLRWPSINQDYIKKPQAYKLSLVMVGWLIFTGLLIFSTGVITSKFW